jgi:transcriptional regulator with XRE-family HTH domain
MDLSRVCGLGGAHISLIESGKRTHLRAATLLALASSLGATVEWLAGGQGDAPTVEEIKAALDAAKAKRGSKCN